VIVQGRLKSRSYETREGEKRTVFEIDVDEVGPSLRSATAKVTKISRSGTGGQGSYSGGGGGSRPGGDDPWATPAGSSSGGAAAATTGGDPWASGGGTMEEPPF
jgi:single-strand DNA-binding protein